MRKTLSILALLLGATSLANSDDASDFALFWGTVLAIEDQCPQYVSRTDATMGGHLSGPDYQWAQAQVERLRADAAKTVKAIGCQRSAEEAAKLMDYSFFYVWTVE